ncbi:MAG: 2-isopropylmalate synthase [Candidatus Micrarchaeota archaeon]
MKKINIFDTTLRDGEQSPGCTMTLKDKLMVARQLEKLNVDIIEAGFPIASQGDFEAVSEIAKEVKRPQVAGLARCTEKDIDRCWEAVQNAKKPRIHIFLATSPIHMQYKLKKTPEEIMADAVEHTKYAANYCENVEFSPEDASRTKPEFLYRIVEKVIEAGATTVNIPDTVGYAIPSEYGKIIKGIKEKVPNIEQAKISVHCHNDLGLAVANSLTAIENGAEQIECTINGIGERAGNCSLEEIVMILDTRKKDLNAYTDIALNQIYPTSRLVSMSTGMIVQRNKAIVGENAFAHEAGIHQHGVLSHPMAYEIMEPAKVGRESVMVIGKHSGKHAIRSELKKAGYEMTEEQLGTIVELIKAHADRKKIVDEEDIRTIVKHVTNLSEEKGDIIKIEDVCVITGNKFIPTATIKFDIAGTKRIIAANGNGPIDAVANAFTTIVPDMNITEFEIKAISPTSKGVAQVSITFEDKQKKQFALVATNEDTILACVHAFLKGANRILRNQTHIPPYPFLFKKKKGLGGPPTLC